MLNFLELLLIEKSSGNGFSRKNRLMRQLNVIDFHFQIQQISVDCYKNDTIFSADKQNLKISNFNFYDMYLNTKYFFFY